MRKLYIFGSVVLAVMIIGIAWAEQITFSTYYPAPHGVYNNFATNKLAVDVTGVGVPSEFTAMTNGDAHIGRSLIVGAGGGSGFAFDEGATTQDGDVLIKGNVGIGTTGPQKKLQVNVTGSTDGIRIDGTTHPALTLYTNGTVRAYLGAVTAAGGYFTGSAANDIALRAQDGNLALTTGSTPRLYIKASSGNVGIGTASPGTNKLEVVGGPIKATGGLIIQTTVPSSPVTGQMWLQ